MNNSLIHWLVSSDGTVSYTDPRQFSIESLPNGLFRLFHYGPGMASLHDSLEAAKDSAKDAKARMEVRW